MALGATVKAVASTTPTIHVGAKVVVGSAGVNVRSTPAGTLVGTQNAGATGTVTAGPTNKVLVTGGPNVVWWDVTFSGMAGWVGQDNLTAVAPPPPPPTYSGWMSKLTVEVSTGPTPATLLSWINANPPTQD